MVYLEWVGEDPTERKKVCEALARMFHKFEKTTLMVA